MKVDMNINRVLNAYCRNSKENNFKKNVLNKKDSIEISNEGREIQKYIELTINTELQNDRVNEIKKLIDEKNYYIDSKKLAKSLIEFIKESDEWWILKKL